MIYLESNDIHSTLTTYLYLAFTQMWSADKQGLNSYINWEKGKFVIDLNDNEKYKEVPNAFEWYFKQPNNGGGWQYRSDIRNPDKTDTWVWQINSGIIEGGLYAQQLHVIKDYYKKNLIFNDTVNARGQQLADKYNIDFSKTIGITWRGTDIHLDGRPYIPIEKYFPWIDKALEEIPDARIACTAEEDKRLDPLFARYPQAFLIEEFYQAPFGHKHNPERFSPVSGFERGLQPVLMVWLFSKCAWYIKNRSSCAAVASWISDGKIVSIAHPENLGYVDSKEWEHKVEFEGKIYEI